MDQQSPHRTEAETLAAKSAAAVQALRDRTQKSLDERQSRLAELEERISAQLELVGEELARDAEDSQNARSSAERATLDELRQDLERERDEWAALRQEQEAQIAAGQEQNEQRTGELTAESVDLESHRAELSQQLAELESAREQFRSEQEAAARTETAELEQLQSQLENERASWQSEREVLESRLQDQTQQIEQLSRERGELEASLETSAKTESERAELASKFELALEDVRRLRERITELEQELADRPTLGDSDDAEAIQLRKERDELAEQVAALESQLAEGTMATSGEANQEQADLQRRFELAVEDVRQLKSEKQQLEEKLAAVSGSPAAPAEPAASDWEAQKRMLLASLEGEEAPTPERQKERTRIEDTVRITDEVVAEKDREISTLQQQLEEAAEESGKSDVDRVVDADEQIRAERVRLEALEVELNERLRAAEMELSTARAKLARQETELEKQRVELEALKNSGFGQSAGGGQVPSKRRWLDKLGLGGDDGK